MDYEAFCAHFGVEPPRAELLGERYYLVSPALQALRLGEQRKPYAKGLYLGMGRREFIPSATLLELLAKQSTRTVTLSDDRSEWLFVCGRDIFADGFTGAPAEGLALVQNARGENLGLGRVGANAKGERLLKNVFDRGNYLRHETVSLGETLKKRRGHGRRT